MCHPHLQTGIKCNKPCYDGYEVENLLSTATSILGNNGFMVERFIKPPVNVTLQFPCHVHIFKICINPYVGRQKSLGFEVFTNSEKIQHSWLTNSTVDTVPVDSNNSYVSVGKINMTKATNICFRNHKFNCNGVDMSQIPSFISCEQEFPLTDKLNKSLQHVSSVIVRITSTADGSIPCLGRLEIWAKPSTRAPKELQQKLYSYFTDLQNPKTECDDIELPESQPASNNNITETANYKAITSTNNIDVPEDFIDPLTCEIMSVPMLLPSGQSIDHSTLENFIDAEAKWGREPNNPFTGIRFSKTYKAVPNVSLKVRIDKYLMENGSHFPNVSRTLGQASDFHNQHMSVKASVWLRRSRDALNTGRPCAHKNQSLSPLNGRFTELNSQKGIDSNKVEHKNNCKRKFDSIADQQPCEKKRLAIYDSSSKIANHENSVTHSLDTALFLALSKLPTFLSPQRKPSDKTEEKTSNKCNNCNASQVTCLYILPCKHKVCSLCLKRLRHKEKETTSHQYICLQCHIPFTTKDVCRLYI